MTSGVRSPEQPAILSSGTAAVPANENVATAARGGGILLLGSLVEYAGRFAFGILVARSLGAAGYGLTVLGVTVATTVATVARVGLSEGIVHFLPGALHERQGTRAWDLLQLTIWVPSLLGLLFGLIVFLLSRSLANGIFHKPTVAPILSWAALAIPFISLGYSIMAATRGFKRMQYHMFAESVVLNLGRLALTWLFLALGLAATGVAAAYSIMWIVVAGLLAYFLNRLFPLNRPPHFSRETARQLFSFSAPICLTQLTSQLNGNSDVLFLGMLGTAAWVGIYSGATRIQLVGVMFLMAIEMVSKPIVSELFHRRDLPQLNRLYQTLTRWCLTFILPYFATILFFASPVLAIFGKDFRAGNLALIVLGAGMLVNAGTGICGAMLIMTGHSRTEFLNILFVLTANGILNVLLIPKWGMLGAAIGTALTVSALNGARLAEVYKFHRLWPYDRTVYKPFAAAAVALGVGYVTTRLLPADQNLIALAVDVAALWISFAGVTWMLGLSPEDQVLLSGVRNRLTGLFR